MNLSDEKDFFAMCIIVSGILIGIFGVILTPCFLISQVINTADVTYEGHVVATIQSSFPWEHTEIHMKTYAEETITFSVDGYYTLETDSVYRIHVKGNFWKLFRDVLEVNIVE